MGKHPLLLLLLAALTLVLVSACYKLPSESVPPVNLGSSECRIVKHDLGEACVPLNPSRVIVLGSLEGAIALGVKPLGAEEKVEPYLKPFFTEAELNAIAPVGFTETGVDIETILKLKPDLILQTGVGTYTQDTYRLLSKAIPMVVVMTENYGQWKTMFLKLAEALGKTEQASQTVANYEARLQRFRTEMRDRPNQKVSLVRVYPHGFSFFVDTSFPGSVLADAGLQRPAWQKEAIADTVTGEGNINTEMLPVLDGDAMFVWTFGHTIDMWQSATEALKRLQTDPLWATLKVVQQERVYEIPSTAWFGYGPIAANLIIDDLFKHFLEHPQS